MLLLATCLVLGGAAPSAADRYDPKYSAHPLRFTAYLLHPIGVMFDYLFVRPAHWLGSQEPFMTIFGHEGPE